MKQQKKLSIEKPTVRLCILLLLFTPLFLTSCNGPFQSGQGNKPGLQSLKTAANNATVVGTTPVTGTTTATGTTTGSQTPVVTDITTENQKTIETVVKNNLQASKKTIEKVLSLRAICDGKPLNWTSIEVVHTLEKSTVECMVTADERLSAFSPLILYAHGPIELRKVKKGREFYFSQNTPPRKLKAPSPIETAEIFQKIRKMLKQEIPEAKTKLALSGDESDSSALRISSLQPMRLLTFVRTLDTHIYSVAINKDEAGIESISVVLETIIGKTEH